MSGQYYGLGAQTPGTYETKGRRDGLHSMTGGKENKPKTKKSHGHSAASAKHRKAPYFPAESMFVDREEVQMLGRMQYTIKAYFPRKE